MNCTNCAAPLPPNSNRCTYCNTLNDVDLKAIPRRADGSSSDRNCPRCGELLKVIQLQLGGGFSVDRCLECHGIFFDPGELETVIEESVSNVYEVDFKRLAAMVEEEGARDFNQVTYIRCPDCDAMMNRRNYGPRSGVIVDQCREHGMWLDGRELSLLLKWTKAGGQMYQQKRLAREEQERIIKESHRVSNKPLTLADDSYDDRIEFDFSPIVRALVFLYKLMR